MHAPKQGRPGEPPSPGASRGARLAVLAMLFLGACSSQASRTPAASPQAASVTIQGFRFQPQTLRVKVGTTVTWSNTDQILHTATSSEGGFDLEMPEAGTSVSFTFDSAGTFPYACTRHASMTGTVEVS